MFMLINPSLFFLLSFFHYLRFFLLGYICLKATLFDENSHFGFFTCASILHTLQKECMRPTVLIIEDEIDVCDLIRYHLAKAGFEILIASNGLSGIQCATSHRPDCIILDLMLPGLDGHEICKMLKQSPITKNIGILMLTAKGSSQDRIKGLELGADDYVSKPFSPRELVLRTQALHRRIGNPSPPLLQNIDHFCIDKNAMSISMDQQPLILTTTEYKLLSFFLERQGRTISRETLLNDVWGYANMSDTRTVDTHIRRLREKLASHSHRLETVRGEGYRFTTLTSPPL